jgi:hypothetical protein
VLVRCSPSPRGALKNDEFQIPWGEDAIINAVTDWLRELAKEVAAHGLHRAEAEALRAFQAEVEARLAEFEEGSGKVTADRVPLAELSAVLQKIAEFERELQVRIAQGRRTSYMPGFSKTCRSAAVSRAGAPTGTPCSYGLSVPSRLLLVATWGRRGLFPLGGPGTFARHKDANALTAGRRRRSTGGLGRSYRFMPSATFSE